MVPLPSEFAEKVNSLMNVGEKVLVRLTAAIWLGRDQTSSMRPKVSSKGALKCHGVLVPRTDRRSAELMR